MSAGRRGRPFRIVRRIGIAVPAAWVLGTFPGQARPAVAQEDFRASDPGRPTRVEDATPLKFREWETELGLAAAAREEGSSLGGLFELKAGLLRNTQVGVELEGGLKGDGTGETDTGLDAVHAHVLHQLGRETRSLPAIALRGEIGTPGVGAIGRAPGGTAAGGHATRSVDRRPPHGNAG
jgi:hypothetical protein